MLFVTVCVIFIVSIVLFVMLRGTMNRLQMFETLRVYWITRDTGVLTDPYLTRAFMLQTSYPFWKGKGIQVRISTYTFQIGILTGKSKDLMDQLGGRFMEEAPKEIRSWQ